MHRQQLTKRAPRADALAVVRTIAGLHAQLASSAELTLWARVDGLEAGAVDTAVWESRTLVKTWAMRGTLHLLAADELGLWVGAQGMVKPRHHVGSWLRHFGLTREQADAMLAAIPVALDGRMLTREALAGEVARLTGIADLDGKLRGGFGDLLKPAAFAGDLCFAPNEGRNVRFARPADWLLEFSAIDADTASREVARRYLSAYGPATRETFARWFGITSPAQAGRWLALVEPVEVSVDGVAMLALASDVDDLRAAEPAGVVRLLPAFDQYVVAAPRDASAVLPDEFRAAVYRPQGWLSPVLVVDGVIVGVWSRDGAVVEIAPFGRVSRPVRAAAEAEVDRLGAFVGESLDARWRE
jgi:Winged helix DNA-binding domain